MGFNQQKWWFDWDLPSGNYKIPCLMGFNGDYRGSMNQKTGMLVDIPSGYVKIAFENGHRKFVDLPMNSMVMFHSFLYVYQRVTIKSVINDQDIHIVGTCSIEFDQCVFSSIVGICWDTLKNHRRHSTWDSCVSLEVHLQQLVKHGATSNGEEECQP